MRSATPFVCASLVAVGVALAASQPVSAQLIHTPILHEKSEPFRYVSDGSLKRTFSWVNPSNPSDSRLWVVEGGGRIRYSKNGGTSWKFQNTPPEAAQMLLGVHFLDDGETGWAAGRGGRLLKTTNGGKNWTLLPRVFDNTGAPAVIWDVHFFPQFNARIGFVSGLDFFKVTTNGGLSYDDVAIFEEDTLQDRLNPADFEFYGVSIQGTFDGSGWTGNVTAEWVENTPHGEPVAVVFRTASDDPQANLGRNWWMGFCNDTFEEPWDIDFIDRRNGYFVGGLGTGGGRIFSTSDGGKTWTEERIDPVLATRSSFATLYGVVDMGNGDAIACGYAGNIWVRNPANGMWYDSFVAGYTGPLSDAAGIPGTGEAWVVGSFGFLRHTVDGGANWTTQNNGEWLMRAQDLHFFNRDVGVVVGQPDRILRTTDGGRTFVQVFPATGMFGPGNVLNGVDFATGMDGVSVGQGGEVLLSSDAGQTWSTPTGSGLNPSHDFEDVAHRQGREYWAVGKSNDQALVLQTTDGGKNWSQITGLPVTRGVHLDAITFAGPDDAFVVGRQDDSAKAFRYLNGTWSDVSTPADPSRTERGLTDVQAGTVNGRTEIYACGRNGVLLRWNPAASPPRFEGVVGFYEFDPSTGVVTVQDTNQARTAVGIVPGQDQVLVGQSNNGVRGDSDDSGYVLRLKGGRWNYVKAQHNRAVNSFEFVADRRGVKGFMLGGKGIGSGGGLTAGTLADSVLCRYNPKR